MNVLDLFAGPGGWDIAARSLGLDPLGIEFDDAACATREAAGLRTLKADVAELDPNRTVGEHFGAPLDGLIASPPCQAWSMAGKRGGEADKPHVYEGIRDLLNGHTTLDVERFMCEDARSMLVVEPLRWALALRPRWIALEQVPPVLELWGCMADALRKRGYKVWTGILSAERYGVPQTRRRAILMAHLDGVQPPTPTHQGYVPGEPAREEWTLEGHLLPWVSMAEALGWGMTARPSVTLAMGTRTGGPSIYGGTGGRQTLLDAQEAGRWSLQRPATNVNADPRIFAPEYRGGRRDYERGIVKRASGAIAEGAPLEDENQERLACGDPLALKGDDWHERRPATTLAGDSRIFQPGGHHGNGQQSENAVRVTLGEAATLQGFPPDYPWQGSRTKQFEQVGNAIPPPLARAILGKLV